MPCCFALGPHDRLSEGRAGALRARIFAKEQGHTPRLATLANPQARRITRLASCQRWAQNALLEGNGGASLHGSSEEPPCSSARKGDPIPLTNRQKQSAKAVATGRPR